MVATEFRSAEASFPMDLPEKGRNAALVLDDEPLVVLVESSGTMPGDVRVQLEGPWKSIHSLLELKNFLKANRADGFGSGGCLRPPTLSLFVQIMRLVGSMRWLRTTRLWKHATQILRWVNHNV